MDRIEHRLRWLRVVASSTSRSPRHRAALALHLHLLADEQRDDYMRGLADALLLVAPAREIESPN